MIVEDVMDEIGDRLDTIPQLNIHPYEADSINTPAALISLPRLIDYLGSYKRGLDKMTIIVTLCVSMVGDKVRRNQVAPYADGTGARSVKAVLETGTYDSFDVIVVRTAEFMVVEIEEIQYLAGVFTVDIAGSGN